MSAAYRIRARRASVTVTRIEEPEAGSLRMATRRYALITFDLDDTLWDVAPVLVRAEERVEQWMRMHCPRVPERFDRAALMELRRRRDSMGNVALLRGGVTRPGLGV